MKFFNLLLCILSIQIGLAQSHAEDLAGNWTIDLRPTPKSMAYLKSFEVSGIKDNAFTGEFYGSPIKEGLINTEWDRLYFAFKTSDSSHTYYHSGYVKDGIIFGISYCPTRAFTAPWTGKINR